MNKVLFAVLFSVLLLIPIGAQQVFGTHLTLGCLPPGFPNTDPTRVFGGTTDFCTTGTALPPGTGFPRCPIGYIPVDFIVQPLGITVTFCVASITTIGTMTPVGSCQDGAVLDANDHCVCEQQNNQCVGGVIIDTDTVSLLAGAIGIDPLLTGLIGITIGGLAVQAVWFVHRRRKNNE